VRFIKGGPGERPRGGAGGPEAGSCATPREARQGPTERAARARTGPPCPTEQGPGQTATDEREGDTTAERPGREEGAHKQPNGASRRQKQPERRDTFCRAGARAVRRGASSGQRAVTTSRYVARQLARCQRAGHGITRGKCSE
jgi:hypothetical protein